MSLSLLENRILKIQSEYANLLKSILPTIKSKHKVEAVDEIILFWYKNMDSIRLYLKYVFSQKDSYVFTAATFLDYDDKEHYPFLLLGEKHILDDPLCKYAKLSNTFPQDSKSSLFKILNEQIVLTAEDNIKIIDNCQNQIIVLPLRILSQLDSKSKSAIIDIGEKTFLSLFNDIDSIDEYFTKLDTISSIKKQFIDGIEETLLLSETDDNTKPFETRFVEAKNNSPICFDKEKSDAYCFFSIVYGFIQQAIDVITSCIEYNCIPYIRYPVALSYISLISQNLIENNHIKLIRYKMSIAFILYKICSKESLEKLGFEEFIRRKSDFDFSSKLFNHLSDLGINEETFLNFNVSTILKNYLDEFYKSFYDADQETQIFE